MTATSRAIIRVASVSCFLIACAAPAIAQTTVRVTHDQSKIWTADFRSTAAVVQAGTILTVVGQRKDWFEVVVPVDDGSGGTTSGFIFKSNVDRVNGPTPPAVSQRRSTAGQPASERSRPIGFLGFGQFSYARFAAQDSFQAVMGQAAGQFFGGGAEVRVGSGLFLNASVERFTDTGQRVVVADGQVFGLGIPDTITLTPMTVTTGWRFAHDRATPYVGAGIGRILYKEESKFVDASDNINTRFTSYHMLGGVEFRNGWLATAFEVEYSRVPGAIGIGGASAAFQESDLGGLVGRIKVLVGR
jgi:opacity protein-like surface antigen